MKLSDIIKININSNKNNVKLVKKIFNKYGINKKDFKDVVIDKKEEYEEIFYLFKEPVSWEHASVLANIDRELAIITSVLGIYESDGVEPQVIIPVFKQNLRYIFNFEENFGENRGIFGFSYSTSPVIGRYIAGFRGWNYIHKKGTLLNRIEENDEGLPHGDELLPETIDFIYSLDEVCKRVTKEEYDKAYNKLIQMYKQSNGV